MTDFGPCATWPVVWTCDVSALSGTVTGAALLATAVESATEILWALTGRQFGLCQVTLRPCRDDCRDVPWSDGNWAQWPGGGTWPQPALIGGLWYNLTCGVCGNTCSCTRLSEVTLPAPVYSVDRVRVDGAVLVTGAYRVDDNRFLVRIDGGEWPRCNDLNRADTQTGTWSVTATFGQSVPQLGALAVGELACELVRAMTGENCRLPRYVQQLARQGVTISFPDVDALLQKGRLGLYLTDLFITAYNPSGLHRRSRTYSVDRPAARRVGT